MAGLPRQLDKSQSDALQAGTLAQHAEAVKIQHDAKRDYYIVGDPRSGTVHPRSTAGNEGGTLIVMANRFRESFEFTNLSTTVTVYASWGIPTNGKGIYIGPLDTKKWWGKLATGEFRATCVTGSTAGYCCESQMER